MSQVSTVWGNPVSLKPETEYTLGCWILGQSAKGNAWARFRQTGETGQVWETTRANQGHSDWTLYETTFTTPAGEIKGQIELVWRLTDQGLFRFDFVSLVEGKTSPKPPNTPPRARSDQFDAQKDAIFGIGEPGLLKNDQDAENDPLTVVNFDQPKSGSVIVEKNGSFTYRPNSGFTGEDSFTYLAADGNGGKTRATVTLNVADFPQPENLIKNASFENALTNWLISKVYYFESDVKEFRSGRSSMRVEARDFPQFARQENIPFKTDKSYRLSAWVKGQEIAGGGISLQYIDKSGKRRKGTHALSGTFDWRKVSVEFGSAREPVEGGSVDIFSNFTKGKAWVDDVTLEALPLPLRIFIDGHSVTGGVIPILEAFGRDAVTKGIFNRKIEIVRSPNTEKQVFLNAQPFDFALICSWSQPPWDKDKQSEVTRKLEWKKWFSEQVSPPRLMIYNWQPWGLHLWPDGFDRLDTFTRQVASDTGLPLIPSTLAFKKYVNQSNDHMQALRQLYFADYRHAGREGNYLKACCIFAAITGKSPVGLTHILPIDQDFGWPPETLTASDARKMQQAAWDSWREANFVANAVL